MVFIVLAVIAKTQIRLQEKLEFKFIGDQTRNLVGEIGKINHGMFGAGGLLDKNASSSDDWFEKGEQIKVVLTASYGMRDWYITARKFDKKKDCSISISEPTCGYE